MYYGEKIMLFHSTQGSHIANTIKRGKMFSSKRLTFISFFILIKWIGLIILVPNNDISLHYSILFFLIVSFLLYLRENFISK